MPVNFFTFVTFDQIKSWTTTCNICTESKRENVKAIFLFSLSNQPRILVMHALSSSLQRSAHRKSLHSSMHSWLCLPTLLLLEWDYLRTRTPVSQQW